MGGKGGKTTTTQTQTVDPDFKARALDVFSRAQTFADQPFRPYTGQRLADFTPMENRGFSNMDAFALSAQPAINAAADTTANIASTGSNAGLDALRLMGPARSLTDAQRFARMAAPRDALFDAQGMTRAAGVPSAVSDAQIFAREADAAPVFAQSQDMTRQAGTTNALRGAQSGLFGTLASEPDPIAAGIPTYMNPYTQSVVDTTLADIERSRQIAQEQNNAAAVRANAFGGSRQAVQAAETDRAALEQAARTAGALRQSGFATAAGLAAQDVANQQDALRARISGASALGQLGATEQNLALAQAGQLGQLGGQQQQLALQRAGQLGQLGATQQQLALSQADQLGDLASAEQQQLMSRALGLGQLGSEAGRLQLAQGQTLSAAELAQRAQQLEAAGQLAALGTTGQTAALQGAQAQLAAGGLQRAQNQAGLDINRQIFMEPEQDQLMRLQVLQQALGMFPNPVSTTQTQTQNPGFLGTVGGLGQTGAQAALAYSLLSGCWVAREVYGFHNPRWLMFREWLFEDAPRWFRGLYLRHGAAFAEWIADKPRLKGIIRSFMDSRIAAKFGEPR